MKWLIIILLFTGCSVANNLTEKALAKPVLKIRNQSASDLLFVEWVDTYGNDEYYCPDRNMYCAFSGRSDCPGMYSGNEYSTSVDAGTGRIYFYFASSSSWTRYWTAAQFTLTNGGNYTITLTGSTLVQH